MAGHIVGVAGEAGGWGGEKWLGGAGGDGWGRWRVGGEEWRGGGGREMVGRCAGHGHGRVCRPCRRSLQILSKFAVTDGDADSQLTAVLYFR